MGIAIAQLIIFTFYIIFIWTRHGIQASLSETWYVLDDKQWMFTVILCFSIGILHLAHSTPLFFFSGAMLSFVGAASDFRREKMTKIVHYVGAALAIILSLIQLTIFEIYWPLITCLIILLPISFIRNKFWWFEIIAFYSILGGIIQLKL